MKDRLLDQIIKCLESENEDRKYCNKSELDIPFMVSALDQNLANKEYECLLSDFSKYDCSVSYLEENEEYSYNYGHILIQMAEKCDLEEGYFYTDKMLNYNYKISFDYDERSWDYCQCGENDPDYDARYNCCGHGCDWDAPSFSVNKIIHIGADSFSGDEHDFWDYSDKFNNITLKDKEDLERQFKIRRLLDDKQRIEKELELLNQ